MKKSFFSFCSTLLLIAALVGCSSSPPAPAGSSQQPEASTKQEGGSGAEQILQMNGREPKTLDAGLSNDVASGVYIRAIYDALVRLDKDGKPVNSVASDIKISEDKKTYTFTLRESKWSNGEPLTAKDFAYAWFRTLDPKTASSSAYKYYPIINAKAFNLGKAKKEDVGIKVIDDKTIEVQLENPTPYFLTLATFYYPVNQKVVEGNEKWANEAATIVTNGPFKIETWEHKSKIVLVKNEHYWDKEAVKLNKIEFSMVEDANTELEMFNQGELDWAGGPISSLPVDAIPAMKEEGKLQAMQKAQSYYLLFQTEQAPFTNEKIRKAFAYAINRQEIVDNILQGGQTALTGMVPQSASLKPEGYFKDNDAETAKQLLAEGMKELGIEKLPEITYLYFNSDSQKKIAEALQAQWRKVLGIEVKLINKDMNVMFDEQAQGKYMISVTAWTADYNDSVNFLELLMEKHSDNNCTLWHSEAYNDLINRSYKETDETKRNQLLQEAESILMNEMPVTGLYSNVNVWVQNDKLKGVTVDPLGYIDMKWGYKE